MLFTDSTKSKNRPSSPSTPTRRPASPCPGPSISITPKVSPPKSAQGTSKSKPKTEKLKEEKTPSKAREKKAEQKVEKERQPSPASQPEETKTQEPLENTTSNAAPSTGLYCVIYLGNIFSSAYYLRTYIHGTPLRLVLTWCMDIRFFFFK